MFALLMGVRWDPAVVLGVVDDEDCHKAVLPAISFTHRLIAFNQLTLRATAEINRAKTPPIVISVVEFPK